MRRTQTLLPPILDMPELGKAIRLEVGFIDFVQENPDLALMSPVALRDLYLDPHFTVVSPSGRRFTEPRS